MNNSGSFKALTYLSLFGLAITLPLLTLSGALLVQSGSVQRAQLNARVLQLLDALVSDIDREVDRDITILHTLATSQAVAHADWRTFYDQAQASLQGRAYLVLVDSNGRQLVNTYVPYGQQPAFTGDPETVRRILETRAPVISNLFTSLAVKQPVFNISIPILQGNQVRYIMSLGLLPDDLLAILKSQKLGSKWVTLIWDTKGVLLARSRDNARYLGKPLPPNMREQAQRAVVRTTNIDGADVLHATARSQVSGWGVGVNVPYSFAVQQIRNSLLLWGAAAILAIAIALLSGVFLARQITTSLSIAAGGAAAFGRGEPFPLTGSRLQEADAFLATLEIARKAREKLMGELKQSRDWLQTTLASIGDAVIATDEWGRITFLNGVAEALTGWTSAEAAGKPLDEVFRIINEFTRATVESPVTKVLRKGSIVGLANHTILIARDGRDVPIDDSAAPIRGPEGSIQGTVLVFRDITERRRAETARELLATVVEFSEDAIVTKDLNGTVTAWNKGAERMLGYSADEMIGRPISVLAAPDQADEMPANLERIKRGERVEPYQTVRRMKNGTLIHVSVAVSALHDASGRITGASKIIRDITLLVRAQEGIAEQRERLRVTLGSIGDAVMATDVQGRLTYLNPVAERLTGWASADAVGRLLEEVFRIVNEESRQTVRNPVVTVLQEGKIVGLANHTLLISKDGKEHAIDDSAAPIRDARGEMMGVVLVFRDVSEKRAAEKLAAAQAVELHQSEERLATVMRHLPVGVGVIDTLGHVTTCNPAWKNFLGGGIPSVDLQEAGRWRAVSPEGRPIAPSDYPGQRALRGEEVLPGMDFLRKDDAGVERWTRVSAVPLRDPAGQIVGALAMLQDIDEETRAEAQRAELLAKERALEAEKALRETEIELARVIRALSLGELASSIAHEVNQPLVGVVTNAEAGLRWLSGDRPNLEEARESLALIAEDGERAGEVIRRLREFLKKRSPETTPLDINEVVQEAVALMRAELERRQLEIRTELSGDLPLVRGDRIQLQQVIVNLIINGAEAMAAAGASKELVATSRRSSDGRVLVAVRDSGVGISAQDMPRMFDAFFTTKPAGMGMGLSISRSILEAHGGKIWAEADEGPGLTVQFSLPADTAEKRLSVASDRS